MKDGKYSQVLASGLNDKLCGDLEGLKKIWAHRGLCHFGDLGSKVSTTLRPQLTVAAPNRAWQSEEALGRGRGGMNPTRGESQTQGPRDPPGAPQGPAAGPGRLPPGDLSAHHAAGLPTPFLAPARNTDSRPRALFNSFLSHCLDIA